MAAPLHLTANGQRFSLPAETTLGEFLAQRGLRPGLVVVERNGLALTPSEIPRIALADGDVLEIVRIVAGG